MTTPDRSGAPAARKSGTRGQAGSGGSVGSGPAETPGGKVTGWLGVIVGFVYLTFPTLGVIELIPDAIPFVGSLDEAAFTALFLWGLRRLGVDPLKLGGR